MRACAVDMHFNISQEPFYADIYRQNVAPQTLGLHFVRACAVEMHVNISPEPLSSEFTGKMSHPRVSPERRHTLCASLRSRNSCQRFTRATLCGSSTEIYRTNAGAQSEHPDQAPLHTYRKNPSVWTHCLGNKKEAKTGTAKSKLGNQETTTPGN